MFLTVWIISIIATVYIADQKKLGVVGYFFLSLVTGPLAVIIALLVTSGKVQSSSNSYKASSLEDAKKQLQDLQFVLYSQEEKIKNLEILINKLSGSPMIVPFGNIVKPEIMAAKPVPVMSVEIPEPSVSVEKSNMELDFGRNWLSKIGITVLALGMAFLISYTFKSFGPFIKIAFGYLVGGAIFFVGIKLEAKEKLMNYGRALMGGAWAIIYFTTYAMYHFDASRVISSEVLDVFFLGLVVVGMMTHTLRYKSEGMMAVALFVAYLTTTIGHITNFTIISNIFLAALILFLVYRFQWVKLLSMGIIMTYGIHYIWVVPNLMVNHDVMSLGFLTTYWAVFFIGSHLVWSLKDELLTKTLAATNFGNIALYSALSYPLIERLFYGQRFSIVLGEGIIYLISAFIIRRLGQKKIYISDIVAAIFAITFSFFLQFSSTTTLTLWLIEVPFLLFIGINFKEKVYKYLSYALAVVVGLRIYFLHIFGLIPDIEFLWASISMAACFYLTQHSEEKDDQFDVFFDQLFSLASCFYISSWVWTWVHQPWTAFSLSMQGWAFLAIGALLGLKRFRAYAYAAFVGSIAMFMFEPIDASTELLKWFIVSANVLSIFGIYHVVRYLKNSQPSHIFYEYEEELAFGAGLIILVYAIFQYVVFHWISLSLGIASVALILIGFVSGNKIERIGGMALLALTLGRVVLVDLSGLDIIFKIITLIVLGVLFLGVSFVYNRFNIKKN